MMFNPLSFIYGKDNLARQVEDQLLVGENIMIAPVCEQNVMGIVVNFPERMKQIIFKDGKKEELIIIEKVFSKIEVTTDNQFEKAYELMGGNLEDLN